MMNPEDLIGGAGSAVNSRQRTVAVVGASADRRKFGNKAARAFRDAGWRVYPVNPRGEEVEGIAGFQSVGEIAGNVDVVSLYVAPRVGLTLLPGIDPEKVGELWINPGAGSAELVAAATGRGLRVRELCSILEMGFHPADFPDA